MGNLAYIAAADSLHGFEGPLRGRKGHVNGRERSQGNKWRNMKEPPPIEMHGGCIVWNEHNTVFGSKDICAQTVYFFLHSTMPIVSRACD